MVGPAFLDFQYLLGFYDKLENVFVKHYAPNHMPDPKEEWSLKENNSELHYGIRSKVNQSIYTLVCNYMPNIRILAKAQEHGCIYMSPAHQSSVLSSIKSIIFVFVTAFSTPLYLCPMSRHKIC